MLKSEDQEWGKRVVLAGYKVIYDPEAVVYHSHHYTLTKVFKEYFDFTHKIIIKGFNLHGFRVSKHMHQNYSSIPGSVLGKPSGITFY